MRSTILLVWAVGAFTPSTAAPGPAIDLSVAGSTERMSDFFSLLARKTREARSKGTVPSCDLSKVTMPNTVTYPLPKPAAGLSLKHISIGSGTQNYTCDLSNSTAVPVAIGAVAVLFNASCVAAAYPDVLASLPRLFMQFDSASGGAASSGLARSGTHSFPTDRTTAFFDLDLAAPPLGAAAARKDAASPAPVDAACGRAGERAVPWLRLLTLPGATGGLREVYRLETVGGSAPATCVGQPPAFQVRYASQYWFMAGPPS